LQSIFKRGYFVRIVLPGVLGCVMLQAGLQDRLALEAVMQIMTAAKE
jgi:hypothetical protein